MIAEIREAERRARLLEPTAGERLAMRERVVGYAERFLDRIGDLPAYVTTEDKGKGIFDSPIMETPGSIETAIDLIERHVDRPGLNPASGGHLGYIPGGGIYHSALGDYLADVSNRYAGVSYGGPGAVRLEQMLIDWMVATTGYPATAGGNLTSGGSIANLIGIVAARDSCGITAREITRSVIYLTTQAHHSVDKAIRIAGLRECPLRHVPVDERYRMAANELERIIVEDERAGLNPWLIVCAAGTTDVGAVDPLGAIAEIAARHHLWMHVDGAYGAFFILCEEGRKKLAGMEKSDSLVMDPHKGLFLPYGSGAVLIRDRRKLYESFWYQANYLQDALASSEEPSPADLSPELTKHFRGLRLWLPLKLVGVAPFRAALEEKLLLARYFHEEIGRAAGFEAGRSPDLSVATFRYLPKRGDANAFNEQLLQEVVRDGRVFLSSTRLDGKFVIRVAVLCFRTHLETIDYALAILKEKAAELERTR
jgi:aromatic-L-amino-acid decarboxylase